MMRIQVSWGEFCSIWNLVAPSGRRPDGSVEYLGIEFFCGPAEYAAGNRENALSRLSAYLRPETLGRVRAAFDEQGAATCGRGSAA